MGMITSFIVPYFGKYAGLIVDIPPNIADLELRQYEFV